MHELCRDGLTCLLWQCRLNKQLQVITLFIKSKCHFYLGLRIQIWHILFKYGHMCIGRMCGFIKGGTHGCTKKCTLFGVNTQFCQSGLVRLILNKFGQQAIQWNSGPLITPATKTVQLIFVTRKSVKCLRHVVAFKSAVELLYKIWPVSHSLRKVVGSYPYGHFLVTFLLCICLQ